MSAIDSANAETLMHRLEYVALPFEAVSENVKNRAILGDFKQKLSKCLLNNNNLKSSALALSLQSISIDDNPILRLYAEGLKQLIINGHPWVTNGWARREIDESLVTKGKEFLEFVELSPTVKNAKKLLELMGSYYHN